MNLDFAFKIAQLVCSIIVITLVFLQPHDDQLYSNSSNINRSKRGSDKLIYNLTIIFGIIFVVISIMNIVF